MPEYSNNLVKAGLLLTISCSNLSNICQHGNAGIPFTYRTEMLQSASSDAGNAIMLHPQHMETVTKLAWKQLEDVTYVLRYNKELDLDINYPIFGSSLKKMAGQTVYISGHMIPLDVDAGLYALSRYTYTSCFFCGGGGPESVISLKFNTKPKRYKTDQYVTLKGKLELNEDDVRDFMYIFRNTEPFTP